MLLQPAAQGLDRVPVRVVLAWVWLLSVWRVGQMCMYVCGIDRRGPLPAPLSQKRQSRPCSRALQPPTPHHTISKLTAVYVATMSPAMWILRDSK